MPTWLRFDSGRQWRIDITADTSTIGTYAGTIRIQTDAGEFTLPTSISVIERDSASQKILWADTPFDGLSGMSTALLDELIRSHHLDIDFTRKIPRNLDFYQTIVLAGGAMCNIWQEGVMRLQNFVESGGRLVVGENAYYRDSGDGLNKIVHAYGMKMFDLDIEPGSEVDVEIDPAQFQTDWQRNLFAGVDRLHFFSLSPIAIENRDAFCIRHPDDGNLIYVSGVKVNSGEVFVIGQSPLLKFFSKAAGNQRLLANLLTNPPTP